MTSRAAAFALALSLACSLLPRPASAAGQEDDGESKARTVRFGVCGALPHFVPELQQAGIQVVREWINWAEIEPVEGRFNWSPMDARVKAANAANIEVLGYFAMTPAWAKTNPGCDADICAIRDMGLFREFARKVAERYAGTSDFGKMTDFELLNEVTLPAFFDLKNTRYEDWLMRGYEGVKAGNPDAVVLIGGFVNPLNAKDFVERMLRDYPRYYDVVSYHVYERDEDAEAATEYLKGRMEALGIQKPLWMTETATIPKGSEAEEEMARGVVKRYVMALAQGVERVFWWPFVGPPLPREADYPPGTVRPPDEKMLGLGWTGPKGSGRELEFHPRAAYVAYKLLTSKLDGLTWALKMADGQYKFGVGPRTVYVLWCNSGNCSPPGELAGRVAVTSCTGAVSWLAASELVLSPCPQFVEPE